MNFLNNNYENNDIIIETLFDIFYTIYLMNNHLNLYHNDCHFNNIIIKDEIQNYYNNDENIYYWGNKLIKEGISDLRMGRREERRK